MATDATTNIAQLLDLAHDRSTDGRASLVEAITEIFVTDRSASLSDQEQALIVDIMRKLLHEVEMSVRRHLAEILSDSPHAPRELLCLLANDDIAVAQPILLNSSVLRDPELIEIIRQRTWEHQLAIAMRQSVSEDVSDGLVEAGNTTVITTLLENPNARISSSTMEYLVEESRRVDSYRNPLVRRQDLPPELAQRMHAWVSAALQRYIVANFEIDPEALSAGLDTGPVPKPEATGSAEPAAQLAKELIDANIDPRLLVDLLREGEISLFESLLGRMTTLDVRLVRRLVYHRGGEGLAVACRASAIPKPQFASIFLLSRQARPGDHNVDKNELNRVLQLYDEVTETGARRLLHAWGQNPAPETLLHGLQRFSTAAA